MYYGKGLYFTVVFPHLLMTNLALMRLLIMQYVVALNIMTYCAAPWIFKSTQAIISNPQLKIIKLLSIL